MRQPSAADTPLSSFTRPRSTLAGPNEPSPIKPGPDAAGDVQTGRTHKFLEVAKRRIARIREERLAEEAEEQASSVVDYTCYHKDAFDIEFGAKPNGT